MPIEILEIVRAGAYLEPRRCESRHSDRAIRFGRADIRAARVIERPTSARIHVGLGSAIASRSSRRRGNTSYPAPVAPLFTAQ